MAIPDKWLKPRKIVPGDVVGIVAPSDIVEEKYIMRGVKILSSWGLRVSIGGHLYDNEYGFAAGTPEDRLADLIEMMEDPRVRVIWAGIGGYVATQLWPLIDNDFLKLLRKDPKWFIGYSDMGTVLNVLTSEKVASIHGPNLESLADWDKASQNWLHKMLFGGIENGDKVDGDWKLVTEGEATGRLLVSGLDILMTSFGTKFDPLEYGDDDLIIGLEEFHQYKSDIQRQIDMIVNHRKASRIKGFVFGRFSDLKFDSEYAEWYKKMKVEDLARERILAARGKIPVVKTEAFGHLVGGENSLTPLPFHFPGKPQRFLALPNGIKVKLKVSREISSLTFLESVAA